MKRIYKIYSPTISFICTFVMAAGVVVLSATLMFNCATTKSADTSSRYVAESTTTSQEVNYKGDPKDRIEKLERVKKDLIELKGLIEKHQELTEIEEQALKAAEEARKKKDEAAKKEEQALKAAEEARQEKEQARQEKEQAAQREKQFLEEAKELCVKMKEVLEHKEKECATNGCDNATRGKLEDAWNKYYSKCSK
jgi:type IV secretory pathway VirB10-like protein